MVWTSPQKCLLASVMCIKVASRNMINAEVINSEIISRKKSHFDIKVNDVYLGHHHKKYVLLRVFFFFTRESQRMSKLNVLNKWFFGEFRQFDIWVKVIFSFPFGVWLETEVLSDKASDGRVVRAGVSVTWHVLSWSGCHQFKPQLCRTWDA